MQRGWSCVDALQTIFRLWDLGIWSIESTPCHHGTVLELKPKACSWCTCTCETKSKTWTKRYSIAYSIAYSNSKLKVWSSRVSFKESGALNPNKAYKGGKGRCRPKACHRLSQIVTDHDFLLKYQTQTAQTLMACDRQGIWELAWVLCWTHCHSLSSVSIVAYHSGWTHQGRTAWTLSKSKSSVHNGNA